MNDEKDFELEDELDNEIEELEDAPEQYDEALDEDESGTDEKETSEEDGFEYDEDGNIILNDEEDEDEPNEEPVETEGDSDEAPKTDTVDTTDYAKELADLKKQMADRDNMFRKALKAVGIEKENIDEAIAQLGADGEGTTASEWLNSVSEENRKKAAEEVYKKVMFDKMVESDLAVLHAKYPETVNMVKFEDIPNYKRFGELRDLGLSAEEAYSAANPGATRAAVAASVKKQSLNETKAHLKSNVPKAAKNNSISISKAEMEECRELFPELSDKEIVALYKKTK